MGLNLLNEIESSQGSALTAAWATVDNPAEGRNGFRHCLAVGEGVCALPLHKQTCDALLKPQGCVTPGESFWARLRLRSDGTKLDRCTTPLLT